ncbi:MAG: type II toxin-antitoxin system RatA family toxin [Pseudomonadota bacterium]
MTSRRTKTEAPFSAEQMFDLVADIEAYPEFIPWCAGLRIVDDNVENGRGSLLADMIVAYKVFRERFRSKVTVNKEEGAIDAHYTDGPFERLCTTWRFEEKPDGGSIIHFFIDFKFKNFLLQSTARTVFEKAFMKMTDAFIERAHALYGERASAVEGVQK